MARTGECASIGKVVRQLRNRTDLTRVQLARLAGVSPSHLTRIESEQRFPSATVLRKLAPHIGISETELLTLAGYLSAVRPSAGGGNGNGHLDPFVVAFLSQEPVEIQRAVISIFGALKCVAEGIAKGRSTAETSHTSHQRAGLR